jgi:hypothetical protein
MIVGTKVSHLSTILGRPHLIKCSKRIELKRMGYRELPSHPKQIKTKKIQNISYPILHPRKHGSITVIRTQI